MGPKIKIPRHGKTPIGAFYSPGVFSDGGGIIIYPGHDGKLHIKHVPPREPVLGDLNVLAGLMAYAETVSDEGVRQQLRGLAEKTLADRQAGISEAIGRLAGE